MTSMTLTLFETFLPKRPASREPLRAFRHLGGLASADGSATPALETLYADLAGNDVGLVISGHAFVDPAGRLGLQQLGAHDDALVPSLAGLARAVHDAGGKFALQISTWGPECGG